MSVEVRTVAPLLDRLQERVRRLEAELVALRTDLEQVTSMLAQPVATYEVDGKQIVITQADVEAIRAQLVRPHSEEAIRELALSQKLAEREKDLPDAEIRRRIADPDDDVVLACALVGKATHLVTYDPHLFSLSETYQEEVTVLDGLHFLHALRGDVRPSA